MNSRSGENSAMNVSVCVSVRLHVCLSVRSHIHRMKWRHRIYGHDMIAILWVKHDIMRGIKGRRFIVLFGCKLNQFDLRKCPRDHWPTNKAYKQGYSNKNLSTFYPQNAGEKRHETKLRHCHPMHIVNDMQMKTNLVQQASPVTSVS